MAADGSLRCLLGNHDLHLLATAHGVRKPSRRDTLASSCSPRPRRPAGLAAPAAAGPPAPAWGETLLMVHAGVLPAWSAADTLALAEEVHAVLRGPDLPAFLQQMYGNTPDHWNDALTAPTACA
jgi:bis(5'-nucleosyl)-tetraphosphatase (symmetrical)